MRFKFTLILLGLNVFTFGLIYYFNKSSAVNRATMHGLSSQIGSSIVEADRIELRGRNINLPRIIERTGTRWALTEPMRWSANYFAINRILNQLQFLEEEASFAVEEIERTGQTLADYGLEEPTLELTIGRDKEAITLSIGTLTEIGNNLYLLGPSRNEIFVINRQSIDGLLLDLSDLRTREIFEIPVFEVNALGLQIRSDAAGDGSSLKVRLAQNNGEWTFETPVSANANPALVNNTITTLTAAKVRNFVESSSTDPADFGLDSTFMEVTLHGNKRRQTLMIGNPVPGIEGAPLYYAKLEENPAIFTVQAAPFDALREAQEALRERNFIDFNSEQLSAVNITEGSRTIRLQKLETEGWQVLESLENDEIQPRRADSDIIHSLLSGLKSLRAADFVADVPTAADEVRLGFKNPRRVVTINFENRDPLVLFLVHPEEENDLLYAKTNQADFIYTVDRRSTLGLLPLNVLHYRTRELEALPQAAEIQSIELRHIESGEIIFQLDKSESDENWINSLSNMDGAQGSAIATITASLRKFEVRRYLFDYFADSYPVDEYKSLPWAYKLSATITLPGGETDRMEMIQYVFTERLSGAIQVGGSRRLRSIFEIPQALIEALYQLTSEFEMALGAVEQKLSEPELIDPVEEPSTVEEAHSD